MLSVYPTIYSRKKDLNGKTIRVIIWGRNEYDGSVECSAKSFNSLDEDPDFYFEDGQIHFIHRYNPNGSFRYFKSMSRHYVFDCRGLCVSHIPKRWIRQPLFDDWVPGKSYADIKIY